MVRRRTSARKKRAAYQGLGTAPAKRHGGLLVLILGALVLVNLYVFVWNKKTGVRAIREQAEAHGAPALALPSEPLVTENGAARPGPAVPARTVTGKIRNNDTLGRVLEHGGITASHADEVIRALSGTLDVRAIRAGQTYRIEATDDGRVVRFELALSKTKRVDVVRQATGELAASEHSSASTDR
jgi:hypothetical protein